MILPESAEAAAELLSIKIENLATSVFFRENQQYEYLTEGARAMAGFLLDRPAMMVSDAQNMDGIIGFIDKEWYEAEHAKNVEGIDELSKELGDTVFFALLSGVLHWEEMNVGQRDFVRRAIDWSVRIANEKKLDIVAAVKDVSETKDPMNYRKEFYQLVEGEKTSEVYDRVVSIGKLHRKIREKLNGEWREAENLLNVLAIHWLDGDLAIDLSVIQIEAMFELAGLDLLEYVET